MSENTVMPLSSLTDQANDYAQRLIEARNAYANSIAAAVEKMGDLLIALERQGVPGTPEGIRGGLALQALGYAIDHVVVDAEEVRDEAAERLEARLVADLGERGPYQFITAPMSTGEEKR